MDKIAKLVWIKEQHAVELVSLASDLAVFAHLLQKYLRSSGKARAYGQTVKRHPPNPVRSGSVLIASPSHGRHQQFYNFSHE